MKPFNKGVINMGRRYTRLEGELKALKTQSSPKYLVFYDTETYFIENRYGKITFPFKMGIATFIKLDRDGNIKKREQIDIINGSQFIEWIYSKLPKKSKVYVFAHNQGFDLRVLDIFSIVDKLGFKSKPPIINDMVFLWDIRKESRTITFIDTANLGVRSVEKLGLDMGFDKLTIDFDKASDEELRTYCIRDVDILEKFVLEYIHIIKSNDLGSFKVTIASQALTTFRTKFYDETIHINNSYGVIKLERDSYYGGRTECFYIGSPAKSNYYYVDVNSMYPYAMSNHDLPIKCIRYIHYPNMSDLTNLIEDYYIIADVTLDTNTNAYPYRYKPSNKDYNALNLDDIEQYDLGKTPKLLFPIGKFRTTLHHNELLLALSDGDIIDVHRISVYIKGQPFNEYIEFFYNLKKQATIDNNPTWRTIAKLYLNSLYGKFGQIQSHRLDIEPFINTPIHRARKYSELTEDWTTILHWYGIAIEEYRKGETPFSLASISGAITSIARLWLYELISSANIKNVFYMDTDSLIVNQEGYDNLTEYMDETMLGMLSLENSATRIIIRSNKDYRFGNIKRFKGLPKTAIKTGYNKWEYLQFQGFITWLNDGGFEPMMGKRSIKSRRTPYNKGIVLENGIVNPFRFQ